PPLCRPVRLPNVRPICGEDVFEVAAALDAEGREFGDVDVSGPVVTMLDEEPASCVPCARLRSPPAAGPYQHPRSLQLESVEGELEVPFLQRGVHVVALGR